MVKVYASNVVAEERVHWEELLELRKQFKEPWILGGDFNMESNISEKSFFVGTKYGSREFCDFIESCKIVDSPLIGRKFTWYALGNKRSRLDRFFVEEVWLWKIKVIQ